MRAGRRNQSDRLLHIGMTVLSVAMSLGLTQLLAL
jgi:hypothetical protein